MLRPRQIVEGQYTERVYSLLRDSNYEEVIRVLSTELLRFPSSRPTLSLLAYAYYHKGDYENASTTYASLEKSAPQEERYKLYRAQCLFKARFLADSLSVLSEIDSAQYAHQVLYLQALIKYEQDELADSRSLVEHALSIQEDNNVRDANLETLLGCISWKEQDYTKARKQFTDLSNNMGYSSSLAYDIALCQFCEKQYSRALKQAEEIETKGIEAHPELDLSPHSDDIYLPTSATAAQAYQDTCLIEAYNMKIAVRVANGNWDAARQDFEAMPHRNDEDLDSISLHNKALIEMDTEPQNGFQKLNFLIQHPPFPPEAFVNLLLLYTKHGYYDLAADIQAENPDLTTECLDPDDLEFMDSLIMSKSSPELAFERFAALANKQVDGLRKITKRIQDARRNHDTENVKSLMADFNTCLEKYIPVLMGQAKIYWDVANYDAIEKLFKQSAEFCSDNDTWRLNVAHVYFMQGDKYKECIRYYEQFVTKHSDNLLGVTAVVLANLCVAYIMISQNENAEELMRQVEKEEDTFLRQKPKSQVYHLCIINLVIGTLYCSKGNFEFGISRIMKSLEPCEKKLGVDTWHYAKRCFLALLETVAKRMLTLTDQLYDDIFTFLDMIDRQGTRIPAMIKPVEGEPLGKTSTVSNEARHIKHLFLRLREG